MPSRESSRQPHRRASRRSQTADAREPHSAPEADTAPPARGGAADWAGLEAIIRRDAECESASAPSLTDALEHVLTEVPRLLPVSAVRVYLVEENGAIRAVGPLAAADQEALSPELAAVATALASRRPVPVPAPGDAAAQGDTYVVPLLVHTGDGFRALGAAVFVATAGRIPSQEDLLTGALLASQVADAVHRRHLDQELQHYQEVQRRLLAEVISAQENERKRITADIHDDILQILGYNLLKVEICQRYLELGDVERLRGEFAAMRSTLEESIALLREIIFQLRPTTLDQRGLLATVDAYLARFEAETGIAVHFSSRLGRRLAPHLETLVYRLVQEALSNVRKHSGATRARIALEGNGSQVRVRIEDNGQGFEVQEALGRSLEQGHIGLHSMRERAELAGGSLVIDSQRGRGTCLTFTLPRAP
ncbi:MAG: sensor histidine kinase [Chloroflexi bacterium]|nr:sensor histidine kinase [Chloroflexota bacterium]